MIMEPAVVYGSKTWAMTDGYYKTEYTSGMMWGYHRKWQLFHFDT
jgi:hypothetical protein